VLSHLSQLPHSGALDSVISVKESFAKCLTVTSVTESIYPVIRLQAIDFKEFFL
jgi:hypothetical protein